MANIHPSAVVSPQAELGRDVSIGPFCVVEPEVIIGDGCRLDARVSIKRGTMLGANNEIYEGAIIGGRAQHLLNGAQGGKLIIGSNNKIREYVTMHTAFKPEASTVVGDNNLFMVGCHVAHDCIVGNNVVVVNNTLLGGHVEVGNRAFVSGEVAVHQFCRIGSFAMVGAKTKIVKDVPPYVTVDGSPAAVVGLNKVGLRRAGFTNDQLAQLKEAYSLIYRRGFRWTEVLSLLESTFHDGPATMFRDFFSNGKRGFVPERRTPRGATLRLVHDDQEGNQDRSAEAA